jgi:cellobionic acid phosphorylase
LFNTGTVSWLYRCLVEGLFGLRGDKHGLVIQPQLPSYWSRVKVTRQFRGAKFEVQMRRENVVSQTLVVVDGQKLPVNRVTDIQAGKTYRVEVRLPA